MKTSLLNASSAVRLLTLFSLVLFNAPGAAALGGTKIWNASGGAWTTAGNWTGGIPTTNDDVVIPSGKGGTITSIPTITVSSLIVRGSCALSSSNSLSVLTVSTTFRVASGVTLSVGGGTDVTAMGLKIGRTCAGIDSGTIAVIAGSMNPSNFYNFGDLTILPSALINGSSSNANFWQMDSAMLRIGSPNGITTSGASGNIQVAGGRSYSVFSSYAYCGTSNQSTGNGLPTEIDYGSLTIANTGPAGNDTVALTNTLQFYTNPGTVIISDGVFASKGWVVFNTPGTADIYITSGAGLMIGTPAGGCNVTYTGSSGSTGSELNDSFLQTVTVNLDDNSQVLALSANTANLRGNLVINTGIFDLQTYTANRKSAGGTLTVASGSTLKVGGTSGGAVGSNFPYNYSTMTLSGSVVEYNAGNGTTQRIYAKPTYGSLSLTNGSGSGTSTKTDTAGLKISADLMINSLVTWNAGSYTDTIGGNFTNSGALTAGSSTLTFTAVSPGHTLAGAMTGTSAFNNLNFSGSGGSWSFGSNAADVKGNFTITAGTVTGPGSTLQIAGNYSNAGTFTHNSGTVAFNGAGAQSLGGSAATTFNNLIIFGTASVTTGAAITVADAADIQSGGTLTVAGYDFTVTGATTVDGTMAFTNAAGTKTFLGDVTIGGAGHWNEAAAPAFVFSGNFQNNGALISGSGVHTFNGSGAHTIATVDSIGILRLANSGLRLTALSPLTVSTNVILAGGVLVLGSNDLVLGSVSASIDTGSAASYVITDGSGRLVRQIGSSLSPFPVGTDSSFNRVECATSHGTGRFSVGMIQGVAPPSIKDSAALRRTFDVVRLDTGDIGAVTLSLRWARDDEAPLFSRMAAAPWRAVGGGWTQYGALITIDTVAYNGPQPVTFRATIDSVRAFGHFIMANAGALPVQIASFTAEAVDAQTIRINWTTISEINSYGFYVEKRGEHESSFTCVSALIAAGGTGMEERHYSWLDQNAAGGVFFYRLRFVDLTGETSYSSIIRISATLGVPEKKPLVFQLNQNYPNPFNPTTDFGYRIPDFGFVTLTIFDQLGRTVATPVNEWKAPGEYRTRFNGSHLGSGIYFYRLNATNSSDPTKHFSQTMKMLLVK